MTESLNHSSDLTEDPVDFYEVFIGVIKEVCPSAERMEDDLSGITFHLTSFESEEDKQTIIDGVFRKIRDKGYRIGSDGVIDTDSMLWVPFVTTTDDKKKLCWSCQRV